MTDPDLTNLIDRRLAEHKLIPTPEAAAKSEEMRQWLEDAAKFICDCCGEPCNSVIGSWRWNGTQWEHQCPGSHPQAGHIGTGVLPKEALAAAHAQGEQRGREAMRAEAARVAVDYGLSLPHLSGAQCVAGEIKTRIESLK